MTVLSGTVTNFFGITTPLGPKKDSAGKAIYSAYITVNITGTYVQNDNAQALAVTTAIGTYTRNGKTVALLDAAFASPGDEAGTAIGAKTVAVSGTGLTFELTGADMSTEHSAAVIGTLNNDICFYLTYTESA